ncbi:hypothetical protein [uncultured Croceicoccus sp.]|nr:hypothetical protein [uncultured Croceicoccus sp.]
MNIDTIRSRLAAGAAAFALSLALIGVTVAPQSNTGITVATSGMLA